ncbi:MAG: hypothetical protein LC109_07835 [Bacteroidia bacterium]|nr:hypothetical protein [Bacteroidia bacterium]
MQIKLLILTTALLLSFSSNAQSTDSIQAQWTHSGLFAKGDYKIHSTTDTSLELIDKPIIVVEGWDPFGIFNNHDDETM